MAKIVKIDKKQRVLQFLQTGEPLTAVHAAHYCGTIHLSQIISDLKKEGYDITSIKKVDLEGDQYVAYKLNTETMRKAA